MRKNFSLYRGLSLGRHFFLFFAMLLLAPAPSWGQEDSSPIENAFSPDDPNWDGLTQFRAFLTDKGLDVLWNPEIRWNDIRGDDIVFFINPQAPPEPSDFASLLRNGGRVVVLDDFGQATDLLARMGIQKIDQSPNAAGVKYFQNTIEAPIAHAESLTHPLSIGVPQLIANMPGYLQGGQLIYAFAKDQGYISEVRSGSGVLIAVADSSLFINHMFSLNRVKKFADNLITYMAPTPSPIVRAIVFTNEMLLEGRQSKRLRTGGTAGRINRFFDTLNDYVFTESGLRWFGIACSILFLCFFAFFFRRKNQISFDGHWTRISNHTPHSLTEHLRNAQNGNYAHPLWLLKEQLDQALADHLNVRSPLHTITPEKFSRLCKDRFGPKWTRTFKRVEPALRGSSHHADHFVSHATFLRVQKACSWLLKAIDSRYV